MSSIGTDIPEPRIDDDTQVEVLTARGNIVAIRHGRAEDAAELARLHDRASTESRYRRFFTAGCSVPAEVRRLLQPIGTEHDCLVAVSERHIIGTASFERVSESEAECAVFVAD